MYFDEKSKYFLVLPLLFFFSVSSVIFGNCGWHFMLLSWPEKWQINCIKAHYAIGEEHVWSISPNRFTTPLHIGQVHLHLNICAMTISFDLLHAISHLGKQPERDVLKLLSNYLWLNTSGRYCLLIRIWSMRYNKWRNARFNYTIIYYNYIILHFTLNVLCGSLHGLYSFCSLVFSVAIKPYLTSPRFITKVRLLKYYR